MKTMGRWMMFSAMAMAVFAGCSKSDNNASPVSQSCLADKLTLTETNVNDLTSQHAVIITFDVKNTSSSENYELEHYKAVYVKLSATTADNKTYSEESLLPVSALDAGATASTELMIDYGAGNTYKSYKIEQIFCK